MKTPVKVLGAPYHVQTSFKQLRDGYPHFVHHDSITALWATKWRPPCAVSGYPFYDAEVKDFDPIFEELIKVSGDSVDIWSRQDEWVQPFLPVAERLEAEGDAALAAGDREIARSTYLRAAAVCRIARFPVIRSGGAQRAWAMGKAVYEKGARLLDPPSTPVDIPFTYAEASRGDAPGPIKTYLRVPNGTPPQAGWPVLLFICGLDAYRTDNTPRTDQHVAHGFATLSFEIPGTGDSPAAPNDPESAERQMSSIIDWVQGSADHYRFDVSKICARGISTGGYNAFRVAHTHADRLFAVVAQGGCSHHAFSRDWIEHQDTGEYPCPMSQALAWRYGYRDSNPSLALSRFIDEAEKFSLITSGVHERPSCQLLGLNGMEDTEFPIEDTLLMALHGPNKEIYARANRSHMGFPGAEDIVYAWLDRVVAGRP